MDTGAPAVTAVEVDDEPYVSQFANRIRDETTKEKMQRRIMGSPAIPICLGMTGVCLVTGLWAFKTGRSRLSQMMQRGRVAFQGLTVAAFVAGAFLEDKTTRGVKREKYEITEPKLL